MTKKCQGTNNIIITPDGAQAVTRFSTSNSTTTMMIPLVLFILPALSLGVAVNTDPLHFPLIRRSLGPRDDSYLPRIADALRSKYGYATVQKRQTSAGVPIINQVGFFSKYFCH